MTDVLVEGFASDAIALARHCVARGEHVRIAGPTAAPPDALALEVLGVRVDSQTDLDADSEFPDIAYLDVWTPAAARRVARLRAGGTRISSLSDLLLHEVAVPTVGITGSAGKSTTSVALVGLLRAADILVHASTTAHAGQLWATEELLHLLVPGLTEGVLVLELTSSHLAFCDASPQVAVVTCVWPDHIELHGSVEAYVAAKRGIVRAQRPGDHVVVNADDPGAAAFAALTPATRWSFSALAEVDQGAFLRNAVVVARSAAGDVELGPAPARGGGRCQAALAAVAAALACGADAAGLAGLLKSVEAPVHRARVVALRGTTELVDDSMAATARKAAATLGVYPADSIVAVLGGRRESAGLPVQASPEERGMVDDALDVVARVARSVVVFGSAGALIEPGLRQRGVDVTVVDEVGEAVDQALARADEADAVLVSPMFPLDADDRALVAGRLRAGA